MQLGKIGSIASSIQYDADAQLYFAQLTPQPSVAYKTAVNTLVLTLKADGNWTGLDRFYILATEDGANSIYSLKNPSSTPLTVLNAPTFTSDRGWTGDGVSGYLDLNYTPSVDGVNFTQNSGMIGLYTRLVQVADTSIILGRFQAGTNSAIALNFGAFGKLFATNANGQDIFANTTTKGFITSVRTASNNTNLCLDGSTINSVATASTALQNGDLFALAWNNAGAAANFSTNQISIIVIGSGALNQSTLYTAIQTFATSRGFNV